MVGAGRMAAAAIGKQESDGAVSYGRGRSRLESEPSNAQTGADPMKANERETPPNVRPTSFDVAVFLKALIEVDEAKAALKVDAPKRALAEYERDT